MKKKAPKLTRSELLEKLSYDPVTGIFLWKAMTMEKEPCQRKRDKYNNQYAGRQLGMADTQSQMPRASIHGRIYYLKTMAFLIMTGEEPKGRTGHLDGNRENLAWINLASEKAAKEAAEARETLAAEEAHRESKNMGGKMDGVRWCHQSGRYWAFITAAFVIVTIGYYRSATAAVEARDSWLTLNNG